VLEISVHYGDDLAPGDSEALLQRPSETTRPGAGLAVQ
jgi:hypothetical protein